MLEYSSVDRSSILDYLLLRAAQPCLDAYPRILVVCWRRDSTQLWVLSRIQICTIIAQMLIVLPVHQKLFTTRRSSFDVSVVLFDRNSEKGNKSSTDLLSLIRKEGHWDINVGSIINFTHTTLSHLIQI